MTSLTHEQIWRRYDDVEARLTARVSDAMVEVAGLSPGMRVLDFATGRGEPLLQAARRVAPHGLVVGVELSGALLQMARERAEREGIANVDLRVGDAESIALPAGHFHAATSRWGLMYMSSPVTALRNARRALVRDGVLVAALWAEPERVAYYTLPRRLLERYRHVPQIDPEAPGTFRHAALDRIERDFSSAGLVIERVDEMDVAVFEATTTDELVAWVRTFGLSRLLEDLSESDQRAWEEDFVGEMESREIDGKMQLGGVTRIVRARPRD